MCDKIHDVDWTSVTEVKPSMELKQIKRDYFWNLVGILAQTLTSPLLLVVVARVHGEASVGLFTLLFSYSLILWALNLWGGRTYQVSDAKKEFSVSGYLVVRILFGGLSLILSLLIGLFSNFDLYTLTLLWILTLFKSVEAVADTFFGVLQSNNQLFITGRSLFLKAAIGVSLFAMVDFFSHSMIWASLAITSVNLILLITYDYFHVKKVVMYSFRELYRYIPEALVIIKRTWQVCAISVITMLTINIPRIFLFHYHFDMLGRFGIIALSVTLSSVGIAFILQPKVVGIGKEWAENRYDDFGESIKRLVGITCGLGVLIIIGTALFGVPVLYLIFHIDLSADWFPLVVMVTGGILNAFVLLFFHVLTIMREIHKLLITLICTNLLLVLLGFGLVPYFSLVGATLTYSICTGIQLVIVFLIYKNGLCKYTKE